MALRIATKASQALTLPALLVVTYINDISPKRSITVEYADADSLSSTDKSAVVEFIHGQNPPVTGDIAFVEKLVETYPDILKGKDAASEKEWISRAAALASPDIKQIEAPLAELNAHLTLRSHVVGYSLTVADLSVWGVLRGNRSAYGYIRKGHLVNVGRWCRYIEDAFPWTSKMVDALSVQQKEKTTAKRKEGGSYDIALPDTEKGVVTRFPPEPSGYLHIGHAKAALLNDYFAHEKYKGTLLLRFDDTNPSKEKEEFQDAILDDLELMGIKPDKTSYTSDYFNELYDYALQMIKSGKAYADDTDQATMRDQRMHGLPSVRRDRPIAETLAIFSNEMKAGSDIGVKNCIRAKMSVDNPNKAMRDPVIYRCNPLPHHRTGDTWKIYPTYDFCCPIVDSLEGVTHALRTIEYRDRNPQYQWMLDTLNLRKVHIWDFARMNFIRTLLSKRKLAKFVDQGVVWGWDDPRFPTIRGIRRRGMTIGALREFILKQGPSRNIVNLDWTIFWATNKKYIDPIAPRHTAVNKQHAVPGVVRGCQPEPYTEDKPRHGKNPSLGTKKVAYSDAILFDQVDAASFAVDEEVTLMNWGNAIVREIERSVSEDPKRVTKLVLDLHLQGDVKKTEKKVTWLSTKAQTLVPVTMVDFDYLITKDKIEEDDNVEDFLNDKTEFRSEGLADENVKGLKRDDIIQFERKGWYRVDREVGDEGGLVVFEIPTGKMAK